MSVLPVIVFEFLKLMFIVISPKRLGSPVCRKAVIDIDNMVGDISARHIGSLPIVQPALSDIAHLANEYENGTGYNTPAARRPH
jgi:hypothetical protein